MILLALGQGTTSATAETIWIARSSGFFISSFDSAAPGTLLTDVFITGMAGGDSLYGIDFHPITGVLYGYAGVSGNLYTINTTSGAATLVGTSLAVPNFRTGMSFNSNGTEIRIVHQNMSNFRINPVTGGLLSSDTNTNEDGLNGIAYNSDPTVFALEDTTGFTYTIGSVGGAPTSPNAGLVTFVGASAIFTTRQYNFDISDSTGIAYVDDGGGGAGGTLNLWTLNLTTGVGTSVGTISLLGLTNSNGLAVQTVPEPTLLALLSWAGLAAGGAWRWRRQAHQLREE